MSPFRLVACTLAIVLALAPVAVPAQGDSGAITVSVLDAATRRPLADARVFLTGVVIASALTTAGGIVRYTDVPAGIYQVRVARPGFDAARSAEFEVLDGKDVTVEFALGASQPARGPATSGNLKVVGSVVVKPNVRITTNDVTDQSPIRKISSSLLDALDTLAGVSVLQSSNDPNAVVTVSLNGHDASQTAITMDGIPFSIPGIARNLRGIGTDLFTSASTSFTPTAAGLGGSVAFRTIEPTQSWTGHLAASDGTYDRWNYQAYATGSAGRLGIAAMHTERGGNDPLTFQTYTDSSGLTYPHGGFSTLDGDLAKLRYRIGDSATLTGAYVTSNSATSLLCTRFVTLLPCGVGPGNNEYGRFAFGYGTLGSMIGNVAITATAFSIADQDNLDELDRFVAGTANPYASLTQSDATGYAFTAAFGAKRNSFKLTGNSYTSRTIFTPLVTGLAGSGSGGGPGIGGPGGPGSGTGGGSGRSFVVPSSLAINSRQLALADTIKSNDNLALNLNASLVGTTGIGTATLAGAGATWTPTEDDSLGFGLAVGSAQPGSTLPRTLGDPNAALFNCGAGTTVVSGPGDGPVPQSSVSYNLSWTHVWRGGQLTVDAYRQNQSGQTINALINSAGEPSGYLPGGYINQLQQAWSQPSVCGATPFSTAGIYVSQPVSGTTRLYQGMDVGGRIALGPNVVMIPAYALNYALLVAADSRFNVPNSTTVVGAQLPARPIHRAGVTFDAVLPRSGVELLANVQYTGSNNNRYLTPYATVAAGVSHQLGQDGRLTVFVTNLFNAVAGDFSTLQYAEPLALSGGGSLAVAANPLTPRQINAAYSVNVGKAARPAESTLEQQARGAARASASGSGGGEQGGGPGGPGSGTGFGGPGGPGSGTGGGRGINLLPPGGDPFALATVNPFCDADSQKIARPILDELRGYVSAYEKNAVPPAMAGFTVTAHRLGAGSAIPYWLDVEPQGLAPAQSGATVRGAPAVAQSPRPQSGKGQNPNAGRFRALFACAYVARLAPDQAKAKGIETGTPVFMGYARGVGIFSVQPRQLPQGGGNVR